MISNIKVSDLSKWIGKINLIDIRSVENYNNNHISTAINIPSEALKNNPNKYLDKKQTYYIYCQRGQTSLRVCSLLNSLGYRTVNVVGGYEAWILEK